MKLSLFKFVFYIQFYLKCFQILNLFIVNCYINWLKLFLKSYHCYFYTKSIIYVEIIKYFKNIQLFEI